MEFEREVAELRKEIANRFCIYHNYCERHNELKCDTCYICPNREITNTLIGMGYRKADEVRKEVAKICMYIVKYEMSHTDNEELKTSLRFILGEIATETGVEVDE